MKLIVGLGNPGKKYAKTRHNIGFVVLDKLKEALQKYGLSDWELSKKFNAQICGGAINNQKILLAKPMTFMNLSGLAVGLIAHYYKIAPNDIIVIHDDKDIKLKEIKLQTNRGSAGHNGVRSIIENIGSPDFTRVRIGIASENKKKMDNTAKFVLKKFSLWEKKALKQVIDYAVSEIIKLIK